MTKRIWMVRAGRSASHVDDFIEDGHVAIGWKELGPLPTPIDRQQLERRFDERYPKTSGRRRVVHLGQILRYFNEISVGDPIMTYSPSERLYYLGVVESAVHWAEDAELPHRRTVKWTHKVPRDSLSDATRNRLGSIATIFLAAEVVSEELVRRALPVDSEIPDEEFEADEEEYETEYETEDEADFADSMAVQAAQLIEDRIAELEWYQLQHLVAGILRGMGYRTTIHEDGADRGVDVFASPDGLGLQEPRIFVEVKHRKAKVSAPQVRSFLGGRNSADRCLYVSTGGFTKDALYEAERSNVPLRLITLPNLRDLLIEHYENLDTETRTLVPLRRLYLPLGDVGE